jgi:2,4-dienoyl-CoA reductase (NADPH2)
VHKGLKKLFEPIQVGSMVLKNRIKLPAMTVGMGKDEGISEQIKAFYAEMAKGGVGFIGTSCTATKLIQDPMLGLYDDRFIPGLRELVEAVHEYGAKVYAQMGVGYSWAFDDGPVELVSPSGITVSGRPGTPFRMGGPFEPTTPRALSREEIHRVAEAYGDGARRAKEAGFDAVEVIASVGYVIAQFMSPLTNKRTDEYGGSLENRMRFFLEIIENIKKKTGKDYPITCRISGADLMDPAGYDLEDTKRMARILEGAGINQIDVMAGWHNAPVAMVQTQVPQGKWVYLAEGVKSAVRIPVAAGTQIQDVRIAERVVALGKVDMVYMSRALIADPGLPNKAKDGRLKDIRPCMNCCRCMEASDNPPVYCSVNARVGREVEYPYEKPSAIDKKVLVIGGGPGGMEAARIASLRGHRVTLCDQNLRLGGALLLASITNWRLGPVLKYMTREIRRLPIEVNLNTRVTSQMIDQMRPDVVVLAVGGAVLPLNVPGADRSIVLDRENVEGLLGGRPVRKNGLGMRVLPYFASVLAKYFYNPSVLRWLLRFHFPFKKNVVILGGNYGGCELAETLVNRGKEVTIIEESGRIGADIGIIHRWLFMKNLREAGVRMVTDVKLLEVTNKGVKISLAGSPQFIQADTVIKVGITTNAKLSQELEGKVPFLYSIGDCKEQGMLLEAVASGFLAGQKI